MANNQPQITFIGQVHSAYSALQDCPKNVRFSQSGAVLEIYPEFEEALTDIEASTHLILLYWLDQADRNRMIYETHLDQKPRGVFAIRAPSRPNPIGFGAVKLIGRRGRFLDIDRIDCLDGTKLVDIKPYVEDNDSIPEASISWLKR